jgi:Na+:H+ antiporter, NhaA family
VHIRVRNAVEFAVENSLLMVLGAIVALVWANTAPDGYEAAVHPLHFAVNDIGMVFFFGLAVKEIIEATAPGGALHSFRRASVPVIAAVGGMIGPAGLYVVLATGLGVPELLRGWAIPCATDIAFSYLVARFVFGPGHPAVPFLLLLAIADDALGLVILAMFYPSGELRPVLCAALLAAAVLIAWWLRRRGTRNFWLYLLGPGSLSWVGLYLGGLHPALALVPVLPWLPHALHDPGVYVDPSSPQRDPLNEFERWWQLPVEVILFLFALTNAGVPLGSTGVGTWIVFVAILVGKPLGIAVTSMLATMTGLHLPDGLNRRDIVVVGLTAGIGFTVALFFATAAFPSGEALQQAKLGALFSLSAGLVALAAAWLLRAGRFNGSTVSKEVQSHR